MAVCSRYLATALEIGSQALSSVYLAISEYLAIWAGVSEIARCGAGHIIPVATKTSVPSLC